MPESPKISPFPLDKPFEQQPATTSLSEVGLRLVANFYTESPVVLGTATLLAGYLLITAKHVLTDIAGGPITAPGTLDHTLHAIQLLPGPEYVVWDILEGIAHPATDLVLLRLSTNPGRSHSDNPYVWRVPRINPFPPKVGDSVAAFGYRRSVIKGTRRADGGIHVESNDEPMVSTGVVREIFAERRDRNLDFPCYQVNARFDGGMSGGPVFDETGSLCGLVCSNIAGSHEDGEPISYVSTLWPIFGLNINADRGDSYPRGVRYPVHELARDGQIKVADYLKLRALFPPPVESGQP